MQLKRLAWLGAGGGALAVWFAAAATTTPSPRVAPVAVAPPAAVDVSGARLAHEIERLHERLRPSATPLQSRDLFHYRMPAAGNRPARVDAPEAGRFEEPPPVAPALTLIGLAEDMVGDTLQRTAIISGEGALFLVKEGDAVGLRYRVSRISAEVVELVDPSDQSTIRLALH
jgi:hypothetical protein